MNELADTVQTNAACEQHKSAALRPRFAETIQRYQRSAVMLFMGG